MQIQTEYRIINVVSNSGNNIDKITVDSFGEEWTYFDHFNQSDIDMLGNEYFDIINESMVNSNMVIADFGCGSGRYSKYWQGKVRKIYSIDPSKAVLVADKLLGKDNNVEIIQASISDLPFEDNFFDFGMSIGVLHHIPDTQKAMSDCVKKIKSGGYFYTYLYYSLDNRGKLFKLLWKGSNSIRYLVSKMPSSLKKVICELLAILLYLPFILLIRVLKFLGFRESMWSKLPLSYYHNKKISIIRNDVLDRFGTPLEQRFSKNEIREMMNNAGLTDIIFSENAPYWHAVGRKK